MAKLADLLSVEDAQARILATVRRLDGQEVPLQDALGRVLGNDLRSAIAIPPFANSSMDGFALSSSSSSRASPARPTVLRVRTHIAAGTMSQEMICDGECARIMTGAPLPVGTDAVVPFEEVEERVGEIAISAPVSAGSCVRPAGQDVSAGGPLLPAGAELGAPQIGLLAATGHASVPVVRRPVIAVLSTGDELVPPGNRLGPGQIYNSNTPMLSAAVIAAGGEPKPLPTSPDDPESIRLAIEKAAGADMLLTSGGASVGDFDLVKDVLGNRGTLAFWRVRIRPGKPLLFGNVGQMPVVGLPGNPTSGMVTFEQFVRPAIRRMLGAPELRPTLQVRLKESIDNRGGRRTYARATLSYESGEFFAALSGPQDSAMLHPLALAHGLVVVPEDRAQLSAGELATMQLWRVPSL